MEKGMISRAQLREHLGVHPHTITKWLAKGRIPRPDVQISLKSAWWKRETLAKVGIEIPPSPPTPAADSDAAPST